MSDNLRLMPAKADPGRAALEQLKRGMPLLLEMAPYLAQLKYATFEALVESGFTSNQALVLVKDQA